jgi:hypothetical protein
MMLNYNLSPAKVLLLNGFPIRKESLLLLIVLSIGVLFLLFWTVLLYKTFQLPAQSKVLSDLDAAFTRNRLLSDAAAFIATIIGLAFLTYWYGFQGDQLPSQDEKILVLGIVLFGSAPYLISKLFSGIKQLKVNRNKKNEPQHSEAEN